MMSEAMSIIVIWRLDQMHTMIQALEQQQQRAIAAESQLRIAITAEITDAFHAANDNSTAADRVRYHHIFMNPAWSS